MSHSQQNIRILVDSLVTTNNMRDALTLEQQILEQHDHISPEDYDWATARLRAFTLPWQNSEIVAQALQFDLLRLALTDIDLKNRIALIILPYPENYQKTQKRELLTLLGRNQELLGGGAVRMWLKQYLQNQEKKILLTNKPAGKELSKDEKYSLLDILAIFDYLRSDLDTTQLAELSQILSQPVPEQPRSTHSPQSQLSTHAQKEYKLVQALRLYPQVNDQQLTVATLSLSNNQTARGTVKNWIYDYRDVVGSRVHNAMDRGKYIFNSKNTKELSSRERNIIALVLKSLDDGTPLKIDIDQKIIIFDNNTLTAQAVHPPLQKEKQQTQPTTPSMDHRSTIAQDVPAQKSVASFALPPRTKKTIKKPQQQIAPPPHNQLAKPQTAKAKSLTSSIPTNSVKKGTVVGTEGDMVFTSQHALPAEKEKFQTTTKQSSPYHMKPIGSQSK